MIFNEKSAPFAVEVERRQGEDVLYINLLKTSVVPSIADNARIMERVIDALAEYPNVSRVVFVQQRNYNYGFEQISLLAEIARIYHFLIKQEQILSMKILSLFGNAAEIFSEMKSFLTLLKQDPINCYLKLKRKISLLHDEIARSGIGASSESRGYLRLLERFLGLLEQTKLIKIYLEKYSSISAEGREVYRNLFRPDILPNFTFTRLMAQMPEKAEMIDQYNVQFDLESASVTILKNENEPKYYYHVLPPEYILSEEQYFLLHLARGVLTEYRPKAEEFIDPEKTRQVFFNVARDLVGELAQNRKINLNYKELVNLARILVRYTIGYGLVEVLLADRKLQDIVLNAPISQNPVFVRHEKYDECVTNILPSFEDAESWATKLRLQSGRPLDEANPVLDSDLVFGNVRARVAAIKEPLSPSGLAFAFRRHRDDPWTLPLFIKNKMINSFTAGLLSFLIDGNRSLLVAGTRSSGKTSVLGALMLEIMSKYRTIVLEDSVTRDSRLIIKENGKFIKTTIGELIDKQINEKGFIDIDGREKEENAGGIEVFCVDKKGKIVLAKPSKFIRHKTSKTIYEVVTTSGKRIKVTGDHSLFSLDERNILKEVKVNGLKAGDFIAIPLKLPFDNFLEYIDLLEQAEKLNNIKKKIFVIGGGISNYINENRKELFGLGYSLGYKKSTIQNWTIKKILPLNLFIKIKKKLEMTDYFLKSEGDSKIIPAKILLDETFLNFIGLWLADGCYDKNSIIVSVEEEENKDIVKKFADKLNTGVKLHSDGFSSMINCALLKEIFFHILELKGNSYTKTIPSWAYNLSNKQIGYLLKGYFSGDGSASDKEVEFSSCSKELINDITSLLLRFEIVLRVSTSEKLKNTPYGMDNTISCRIGSVKMLNRFKENIGFLVQVKQANLEKLCSRVSTHDTTDVIPISLNVKKELRDILGNKSFRYDYINRGQNIGREKLNLFLEKIPIGITNPVDPLRIIVKSNIFWDKIKDIKIVKEDVGYVYDISVPEYENFICENIVAHNTLELPIDSMRKLGYNILRMKVRSALVEGTNEVEAAEGIRTSLRLGDSALIVGEVRSMEAKALYEAMRIGALANVVAGTIHGDSPYGVFDRVVNDLGVPETSFKATDLIVIANPVKTPDGMHSMKRVISLTEVRKQWTKDPLEESGFVDLLRYNVEKDELEPTAELINGDSEIIKAIASSVKGWAGNWDAVYDNILLRGKCKQEIVLAAEQLGKPQLLEAAFNVLANNAFHRICDIVREEKGLPWGEEVFPRWKKWMYENAKEF